MVKRMIDGLFQSQTSYIFFHKQKPGKKSKESNQKTQKIAKKIENLISIGIAYQHMDKGTLRAAAVIFDVTTPENYICLHLRPPAREA